ncbi:MAG: phosphopantothenoylcysteine decarboxylase [Endomicrobiales bacterium]|nr:phosphopantothenoylcysteine decarboxylase [Endomicrobiales bacterium]
MLKLNPSVLITAGSTREFIDPVRYISNSSSGKMGAALASAALAAGSKVTVICAQVSANFPKNAKIIKVISARQMFESVKESVKFCQIFISAAAVADFAPVKFSKIKLKKSSQYTTLKLKKTPDILQYVGRHKGLRVVVGFALESENLEFNAQKKLKNKNLDFIVANGIDAVCSKDVRATLIFKDGKKLKFAKMKKEKLAKRIIYEALHCAKTAISY